MLKIALLVISLASFGCAQLPPFPEVWQCAYSSKLNKFRCVNTRTKQALDLRRDDPNMEGAQCMSIEDYRKSEAWIDSVIEIANQRCH
jgi:hypothetical protein